MEAALKVVCEKIGLPDARRPTDPAAACRQANDSWAEQFPRNAVLEFSRDRKSMSTLCGFNSGGAADEEEEAASAGMPSRRTRAVRVSTRRPSTGGSGKSAKSAAGSGKNQLFVKGAPESVIARCSHARLADGTTVPFGPMQRARVLKHVEGMAAQPLRCLAMAIKEDVGELSDYDGLSHRAQKLLATPSKFAALESEMIFVGLRVVMITGDTKPTAEAIAREIGIFGKKENIAGRSFTGHDFFALSDKKRNDMLTSHSSSMVFSRTEPRDKQELIKILKRAGEVTAMTGDGVNDAPALKQAAIGIAMGISGTEVAKEASDMVLADDNFATIVAAVEEGRSIYSNMKAFIRYL